MAKTRTVKFEFDERSMATKCEDCDGDGWVYTTNRWSVDRGTRWERSFEETNIKIECPTCGGLGCHTYPADSR